MNDLDIAAAFPPIPKERQSILVGRAVMPLVIGTIYGVVVGIRSELSTERWLDSYVMFIGGSLSCLSVASYSRFLEGQSSRTISNALSAMSGFLVYGYCLYLMGYCGTYRLYLLSGEFSWARLLAGLFWIAIGYRGLYGLWVITELVERRDRAIAAVAEAMRAQAHEGGA